jgi:DNA repair protein RadD
MITPRWYQEEAILAIYNYFLNGGKGNPLIALPTASGKSIIPAIFIQRVMQRWPSQRFLLITHVKELIKQNSDKLLEVWDNAPLGIYSAGLKRRDIIAPVIYGGIQSMIKIAEAFGHRDIIFVDEAHLISQEEDSNYLRFFAIMKAINPNLKIVGMTATPFRMGQGMLTDNGVFTDIIYDMTDIEGFNRLIKEGYLSPLYPKPTNIQLDVSNVGMQKGEFIQGQLQHEVDKAEITWKALQELAYYGQNRRSWIIFSSGIEHANHIAEMLWKLGIECASVHSKQTSDYNDAALKAHKELRLRAVVSFSKLTTGLDHPAIDLIADLRPTMSVVLHIQKYGRGMRLFENKRDCLALDFAKNIPRLGCVNDPIIPRKKGEKTGEIPIKICEACGVYNHISARVCSACGAAFEFKVKIVERASTDVLLKEIEAPVIETFDVNWVTYAKKQKEGKNPYIATTYFSGMNAFKEFVFPENHKFPKPYVDWWRQRSKIEPPKTTDECMQHVSTLRAPKRIRVHVNRMLNGRLWPEVLSTEW